MDDNIEKSKEELQRENILLRLLINNFPSGIYIKDTEGRKIIVNPLVSISDEKGSTGYKQDTDVINYGKPIIDEQKAFSDEKGNKKWKSVSKIPLKDDAGNIIGMAGISNDITSQKQVEAELILAKQLSEENSKMKSAFLVRVSHEIRTPLNCILGFTELILEPEVDSEQRAEYSKMIIESGNNLVSVINDVLDLAKIESKQIYIWKSIFPAQKLIKDIYTKFEKKVLTNGLVLKISPEIPMEVLTIESDEIRLNQILDSFVNNAIKFSEKGIIEIGLKQVGNMVRFFVKDTGIGIEEDNLKDIFTGLNSFKSDYNKKFGGTGLGLAISKSLAEILNGEVGVKSKLGEGSEFFVDIPLSNNI